MFPVSKFKKDLIYYKLSSFDFRVKQSRYTFSIIKEDHEGNIEKNNYSDSRINFKVLHVANRLKEDISKNLGFFCLFDYSKIEYNRLNEDFERGKEYVKIDIKSAYLNALNNSGYLSEKMYKEINELPKKDRLIALGMLAYEPDIFYFQKGQFVDFEKVKNEYKNVFLFCANETGRIMKKIALLLKNDFVFFWVDGIYLVKTEENIKLVADVLNDEGYYYTVDTLKDFDYNKKDDGIHFNYIEKGEKKEIHLINQRVKKSKEVKNIMLDVKNLKRGELKRLMKENGFFN